MRYVALFCYVSGFAAIGQAWFAAVPMRLKLIIAGTGVVLVILGFLIQWFLVKK
jgi:hypothetical protein